MTQLTDSGIYAVEVPDDAKNIKLEEIFSRSCHALRYHSSTELPFPCDYSIPLPDGSWRFLFTTKGATEHDARQVVRFSEWYFPERHIRFVDYAHLYDRENKQGWKVGFATAIESLKSLLTAKGCDTSKNHALIQK